MDEHKSYFKLGLFVVSAVVISAAVLFILGGRSLFTPKFTFETYFNESVAGMDVGAAVKFRGVPLGRVTEITSSFVQYETDLPFDKRRNYIVVRCEVSTAMSVEDIKREFKSMIGHGMRVQTQMEGITGQLSIGLDILDAAANPPLPFAWKPKYDYVPSAPSMTGQIIASAQQFIVSLNDAQIQKLSKDLDNLVQDVDKKVKEFQVADLSDEGKNALKDARGMIARVNGILDDPAIKHTLVNVDKSTDRLRGIMESGDIDRIVKRIDDLAARLDGIVADNQYDVGVMVQDLRAMSENLRSMSEQIKNYPAGAILGGPPAKVQLPGKSP